MEMKEESSVRGGLVLACALATLGVVLGSLWCYPGPYIVRPYPGPAVAAGGALTVLAALAVMLLPVPSRGRPALLVAGAFSLWWALSAQNSLDGFRAHSSLAAQVGAFSIMLMTVLSVRRSQDWRLMAYALVGGATLVSLYYYAAWAWWVSLRVESFDYAPLWATFSESNSFSVVPLAASLLCLGLLLSAQLARQQIFLLVQLCLLLAAILMSGSRASLLALLLGLVAFGWIFSSRNSSHRKASQKKTGGLLLLVGLPLATASGLLFMTGWLAPSLSRVHSLVAGNNTASVIMRQDVLAYGLETTLKRPVLGSGPGNFALAYQETRPYREAFGSNQFVFLAHNDFVEIAVESGLVGFLLWLALLVATITRAARFCRHGAMPSEAAAVAAAVLSVAVYSALNFVVNLPALLFWWFSLMGLAIAIPVERHPEPSPLPARIALALVLALAGGLTLSFGVRATQANRLVAEAVRLEEAMRWEEALVKLDEASRLQPSRAALLTRRAKLRQNLQLMNGLPETSKEIGDDLVRAMKLSPRDQEVVSAYVGYLRSRDELAHAERVLQVAHHLTGYQNWILQDLLAVQLLQDKTELAAATMRELALREPAAIKNLVLLLAGFEQDQPDRAVALLEEWCQDPSAQEFCLDVAERAGDQLLSIDQGRAADSFYRLLEALKPRLSVSLKRARAAALQGKKAEQIAILEKVLSESKNPEDPSYEQALVAWAELHPGPKSTARLEKYLLEHPSMVAARLALATRYESNKGVPAARKLVDKGLEANPNQAALTARMGSLFLQEGANDLARGYFKRALELDPKNSEALHGLVRAERLD